MKKIFCDICGNEFEYDDKTKLTTGGHDFTRIIVSMGKEQVQLNIDIRIVVPKGGQHKDICSPCRWEAIALLNPHAVAKAG